MPIIREIIVDVGETFYGFRTQRLQIDEETEYVLNFFSAFILFSSCSELTRIREDGSCCFQDI